MHLVFLQFLLVVLNATLAAISPNPITISMLVVVIICFAVTAFYELRN